MSGAHSDAKEQGGDWPTPWPMPPPHPHTHQPDGQPITPPHNYAAASASPNASDASSATAAPAYPSSAAARRLSCPASGGDVRFWHARSPHFRFFILALATLVPFGGHVIKYSISSLQHEMLADAEFGLDHTQMGMFQSAVSIPNLFMPLLGGLLLDLRGNARGTILMLLICLLGHLGFVLACAAKSFKWALIARIIFGLGQGSTVVAQGRICATWFAGSGIVFAVAATESVHNLSNFIAFVYVVPVSEYMGGYIWSLWMGVGFSVMSLLAGLLFFHVNPEGEPTDEQMEIERQQAQDQALEAGTETVALMGAQAPAAAPYHTFSDGCPASSPSQVSAAKPAHNLEASPSSSSSNRLKLPTLKGLSVGFFILCIVHMTFSNCYHLFAYVSATLIRDRFNTTVAKAGWLAGLTHGIAIFLCPLAGIFMDWFGYKMWILAFCGALSTVAFMILLSASVSPIPSLVMLAVVVSFTPTIKKSAVPNLVKPAVYGVAYGLYVISESVGSVIGNMAVGFLRDSTHSWDLDIQIFAGMAAIATLLTLVLIFLDHMHWLGEGEHGQPLGGLNAPSREAGPHYQQLKKHKDLYLVREHRRDRRRQAREARQRAKEARLHLDAQLQLEAQLQLQLQDGGSEDETAQP